MKKINGYQQELSPALFRDCPKAVFAAIAVSAITFGGANLENANELILAEWWVLYENEIVPQKPPFPKPSVVPFDEPTTTP